MHADRPLFPALLGFILLLLALAGAPGALAQSPQYALGNRVWLDTDNSGTINGSEVGLDGVTINLYAASDLTTILSTTVTANGGYYLFNNLAAGDYVVAVAASNFSSVLSGYWSSGTTRNNAGAIVETTAPAANTDIDSDDNGTLQTSGPLNGAVTSSTVTLGPGTSSEPTGETDLDAGNQGQPDGQANMTVDFGFYTIALGNQAWNDTDNSGTLDAGESGLDNVTVELWSGDASTLLTTTTTSGGGFYSFGGLPAGSYIVRLPAINFNPGGTLRDYRSSTGPLPSLMYEPAPNPNVNHADSDDNGTEANGLLGLGGYIQSQAISLVAGTGQSSSNANGSTIENRLDFGVNKLPQIDLSVSNTDNQASYLPGATLNYIVVVTNHGPADADGMTVSAARPSQITSWIWTCDAATPAGYNCSSDSSNPATFTDSLDLPQLASVTYHVSAQVAGNATGNIATMVIAFPPTGMSDLTPLDNIATDTDTLATTTLAISKTASPSPVNLGGNLTYTLQVTNTGAVDAVGLALSDALPPQLSFQNVTGNGWNCGQAAGVVTCTLAQLAPGTAPPIVVTAKVTDTLAITNAASVLAVNAASATTNVQTFVVGPVIPTLSQWGMALLALTLAGASVLALRRR